MTEAQKEALRAVYDTVLQRTDEAIHTNNKLEYVKWSHVAEGLLRAGRALDFDLYQDWCQRHP